MKNNFNSSRPNILITGCYGFIGRNLSLFLKKIEKDYVFHDLEKTDLDESLYRNLTWHPKFDPNENFDKKTTRFVLSIDTGEGKSEEEW
jgi:nucleoside-diphosphate-sugar epimerase